MAMSICKTAPECNGFICGSHIIKNSIPADRLELDSFKELFREMLSESFKEKWFMELMKEFFDQLLKENWYEEHFKELLEKLLDKEWFEDYIKKLLEKFSNKEWFYEHLETIIENLFNEDWFMEKLKELFSSLILEDWFKDMLCSLQCLGDQDIFEVDPQLLIYDSDGGEQTFLITVGPEDEWTIS